MQGAGQAFLCHRDTGRSFARFDNRAETTLPAALTLARIYPVSIGHKLPPILKNVLRRCSWGLVGRALDDGAANARRARRRPDGCVVRFFQFVCVLMLPLVFTAYDASARPCGANSDSPMVWNDGFGVSRCRAHRPRYHTRDYDGQGARGYATSSDPMVWSDAQWRSTLMDGYSRNYDSRYDRRFRREPAPAAGTSVRVERQVEVTIRQGSEVVDEPQVEPRRARLFNVRTASEFKTNPGVLRFNGHDCRGVLVLTWGSLGSKMRCHEGDGRIKSR